MLAEAADELQARRASQYERDETHNPSVTEAAGWAHPLSHRLWERCGSHPQPLAIRLGTAPAPPDDPVIRPERGRPDLRAALDEVCAHNDASPRPVTVDLEVTGGIALVGDEIRTRELAGALLAQLALLNPPGELAICLEVDRFTWQWADWLPHTTTPGSRTVWMCQRNQDPSADPGSRRNDPTGTGSTLIWTAPDTIGLPGSIRALVHFDNHGIATLQIDHGPPEEFVPELLGAESLEFCARRLAGFAPGSEDGSGNASTPERVTLTSLGLQPEAERILDGWRAFGTGVHDDCLSFPLGAVRGGGVLVIDLVRDGPHALVAGTTGAGKSELLRTMLLGLATRYPPDRLNMFLVDYKGGAAFGALAELPHCVGLLTDLRGHGADRTLTALRAELRRRETLLEHHAASNVSSLDHGVRPASLMLVVDEFATLVTEVPDFLDGMLDVAQRGRSLGIHLVLATQRPAGVISDAIRANTSLRIALRLPDADDSTDVIGSPLAAGLPRELPGRALVRLDHDQLVTIQVAYSGSVPSPRPGIRIKPLHAVETPQHPQPCTDPEHHSGQADEPDELEALCGAIIDACEEAEMQEAHKPIPPPLPEVVTSEELAMSTDQGSLCIGVVDQPELQRCQTLTLDPERLGGVLVVGAPSSGVSTTLEAIAEAADRQGGWQVHAIATSGGLDSLAANASVRDVVDASDHEPLRRMLEELAGTTAGTGSPPHARRLVILDGFGEFEQLQEPVNRGWAIEAFLDLAANGRRHGLFVAVSAHRRMEVPPSLLHHLGDRIVLRTVDEDEAAMMDGSAELARVDLPPGRAWVRGHWAQVARPSRLHGATPGEPLRLDRDVPVARLHPRESPGGGNPPHTRPWSLPVGIGATDLHVATLDLSDTHALISGSPGSGRTTALETIAMVAESVAVTVLCVPGAGSAEVASRLTDAVQRAIREPAQRFLVLMDDLDRYGDDPGTTEALTALLGDIHTTNLRLVAAGDPMGLLRCYSDPVTRLRSMRTGVLLGADAHDIGDILHHELHRRDDIPPAPGRGWLCHRGNATVFQMARP
jgi:S-DNA-T family DNA segregation ATPase FtsK/SpoIIIE